MKLKQLNLGDLFKFKNNKTNYWLCVKKKDDSSIGFWDNGKFKIVNSNESDWNKSVLLKQ